MNKNSTLYFSSSFEQIIKASCIIIYGAGTMGKALFKCLSEPLYNIKVDCFIVKSKQNNPDDVEGVPVIDIENATSHKNDLVLVALNGKLIGGALEDLKRAGFSNVIPISFDGDEWTYIRHGWIVENNILSKNVFYLSSVSYTNLFDYSKTDNLHLYVVHSIYDRKLNRDIELKEYEIPIQVGAGLTDSRLFETTDLLGDNISKKNKQYCELTGIYWAWKNDDSAFVGFSHYRRRFVIDDSQLNYIFSGDIDVVVTEPILNFITVKGQYSKDHDGKDWKVLMEAISVLFKEYLSAAIKIQNGIYYFAYNMFIMKRKVFREYCSFIFPLLEYCEKKIGVKEDGYQNRYVGFLAERLLSIFLEKNNDLRVAIADKTFLE